MTRQITPAGLTLIKASEGCRLTAYQDVGGVWTIGYGSTHDVHAGLTVTQAVADARLVEDLATTEDGVDGELLANANDNVFSALVSFAYNEGLGTLRESGMIEMINAGKTVQASAILIRYNEARVNGKLKVLPGLTIRRHNEQALMLTPAELSAPPIVPTASMDQTSVPAVAPKPGFWQRVRAWFK